MSKHLKEMQDRMKEMADLGDGLKDLDLEELMTYATKAMAQLHSAVYFFYSFPLSPARPVAEKNLLKILADAVTEEDDPMPDFLEDSMLFAVSTVEEIIELRKADAAKKAEDGLAKTG